VVDRVALDRIFSSYFASPLLAAFRPCSTLVYIHMSLLPEEKVAKPKNCPKCSAVLNIEERWVENIYIFLSWSVTTRKGEITQSGII
jgi:hypothetical protein